MRPRTTALALAAMLAPAASFADGYRIEVGPGLRPAASPRVAQAPTYVPPGPDLFTDVVPALPPAKIEFNPPTVPPARPTAAEPDRCQCPCRCADCACPVDRPSTPSATVRPPAAPALPAAVPPSPPPSAPRRYVLTDATGQAWHDTDPANLSRWVAARNAAVARPAYFPAVRSFVGGACVGGSCR